MAVTTAAICRSAGGGAHVPRRSSGRSSSEEAPGLGAGRSACVGLCVAADPGARHASAWTIMAWRWYMQQAHRWLHACESPVPKRPSCVQTALNNPYISTPSRGPSTHAYAESGVAIVVDSVVEGGHAAVAGVRKGDVLRFTTARNRPVRPALGVPACPCLC